MDPTYGNQAMGSGNADFYSQFDQNISSQNAGGKGEMVFGSEQPAKRKKLIFIAIGAAVLICIVAILLFVLNRPNGKNSSAGSIDKQLARDYAGYIIFGDDQPENPEDNIPETNRFYFRRSGSGDPEYLDNAKEKLSKVIESATGDKKSAAEEQLDLLDFYRISSIFLDDYYSNYDYSQIQEQSKVADLYNKIGNYVKAAKDEETAIEDYDNGLISEEEYTEFIITSRATSTLLRTKRQDAYLSLMDYARSLYDIE